MAFLSVMTVVSAYCVYVIRWWEACTVIVCHDLMSVALHSKAKEILVTKGVKKTKKLKGFSEMKMFGRILRDTGGKVVKRHWKDEVKVCNW